MNGIWLALLLGRWSMVTGWCDLLFGPFSDKSKKEFVSVDARLDDLKKDTRSYEMLSRDDSGKPMDETVTPSVVTPVSPTAKLPLRSPSSLRDPGRDTPANHEGRRTPDYFGHTARYHAPVRSFSSPRPPQTVTWDAREMYARPGQSHEDEYVNPLGLNRI
jgi:hypothetical protein